MEFAYAVFLILNEEEKGFEHVIKFCIHFLACITLTENAKMKLLNLLFESEKHQQLNTTVNMLVYGLRLNL